MSRPLRLLRPLLLLLLLLCSCCHQVCGILCVQCESRSGGNDDPCVKEPPKPQPCDDSMSVCMTVSTYTPGDQDARTLVSLVRTCAPTDMGRDCEKGKAENGKLAEVCHSTCSWNGCNHAHHITTTPTLLLLLLHLVLLVLGGFW